MKQVHFNQTGQWRTWLGANAAKRDTTRAKRIREAISLLEKGRKLGIK